MYFVILHNNCKESTNFELEKFITRKFISKLEYHILIKLEI